MPKIKQIALIEPRQSGIHVFLRVTLPRLGMPILATQLDRMGVKARVFIESMGPIDWQFVRESDAVFLSATTSTVNRAFELARQAKAARPDIVTAVGGPHVSFLPDEALSTGSIDYVFRGEADTAMPEFVAVLEGDLKPEDCAGLSALRDGSPVHAPDRPSTVDLNALPAPDFGLMAHRRRMRIMPMEFSRGCPYDCAFCAVVRMFGRSSRQQTVESALDQLERKRFTEETLGLRPANVFIYDDNHTARKPWARELWETAARRKLLPPAIAMQTRADVTSDPDLMRALANANCRQFFWGIESIDNETLESVNKRQTIEQVAEAVRMAKRFGIAVHGMFVVGFDADTPATVARTAEWAIKHQIDTCQILILTPLPGTPLYEQLRDDGRIFDDNWDHYDAHHVTFQPANTTPLKLQLATYRGMARFYSWLQIGSVANKSQWVTAYLRAQGHGLLRSWRRARETKSYLRFLRGFETGRMHDGAARG